MTDLKNVLQILRDEGFDAALGHISCQHPESDFAVHFQATCALRALPIYKKQFPDDRSMEAQILAMRGILGDSKEDRDEILRDALQSAWSMRGGQESPAAWHAIWSCLKPSVLSGTWLAAKAVELDGGSWEDERNWQERKLAENLEALT